MHGLAEYEVSHEYSKGIRRETGEYVVRDLSWELARYLDTEGPQARDPAPPESESGNSITNIGKGEGR